MTLGSFWGPASQSPSSYVDQFPQNSKYFAGERGDTGGGYPYSSSSSSSSYMLPSIPTKGKKDKKQAAMSALTLIAFLFFLNILKECIQAEMHPPTAMIMMMPTPTQLDPLAKVEDAAEPMGKYEEVDLKTKENFVKVSNARSLDSVTERYRDVHDQISDVIGSGLRRDDVVRVRKLLSIEDKAAEDDEKSDVFVQFKEDDKFSDVLGSKSHDDDALNGRKLPSVNAEGVNDAEISSQFIKYKLKLDQSDKSDHNTRQMEEADEFGPKHQARKLLSVIDEGPDKAEVSGHSDIHKLMHTKENDEITDESEFNGVKIRKLLSVQDEEEEGRQGKFIENYHPGKRDWTNQLSQISEDELLNQRKKLDQLKKLWKKRTIDDKRLRKPVMDEEVDRIKVKKFVNSPVLSDVRGIPKLSQYWARQRTTTTQSPETKFVVYEEHPKKVADFEEFKILEGGKSHRLPEEEKGHRLAWEENTSKQPLRKEPSEMAGGEVAQVEEEVTSGLPLWHKNSGLAEGAKTPGLLEEDKEKFADVAQSLQLIAAPIGEVEPVDELKDEDALNTPRYRRSEEILTTLPTEELFRPEGVQVVTPNPTSPPSTTRTYHVYTNPAQIYSNHWKTTQPPVATTTTTQQPTTGKMDIEEIYFTTTLPPMRYQPYPNHRPSYKPLSRYRYSPNRRVAYEPPVVRQEYYPMSVVGQYGGEEDTSGVGGVLQLFWTLISSFARPISRIIPQMSSKVGGEAQCLDLLACEAHRIGHYVGPTAKSLATTFSTVLQWVTPPNDKPALEAAIAAGKENSCVEQIAACDDRSGGKSAMTMVAQLMELRGEAPRRP